MPKKKKKKKKIVEYMGQGVCADYGVFCVLLDLCGDSKPLQVGKSVNGFLKCSVFASIHQVSN